MKLKSSLVIALLAVALSAVVAVAAPSADAKKGGSLSTPAAGTTTTGLPVTGTFTITRFAKVNGKILAIGTFTGSIAGGDTVTTRSTSVVQAANGKSLGSAAKTSAAKSSRSLAAAAATCDILDLTLGPLHLDLLGLVVDLNQVHPADHRGVGPGEPPREPPLRGRRSARQHRHGRAVGSAPVDCQPAQSDPRAALARRH